MSEYLQASHAAAMPPLSILHKTIGAVLVGHLFSVILSAITTVQWWYYRSTFKSDALWVKCMVNVFFGLDIIQVIFQTITIYHYLITCFGDTQALERWTWQLSVVVFLEPWSGAMCQVYLARMLWTLNPRRHRLLSLFIIILALTGLGLGTWTGITAFRVKELKQIRSSFTGRVSAWHACSTAASFIVTVGITVGLWTSRTGFNRTDQLITRLIIWTIGNGGLMCTFALANTITFLTVSRPTLVYLSVNFVLTKVYSNTVLASLNRRSLFRRYQNKQRREQRMVHEDYSEVELTYNTPIARTETSRVIPDNHIDIQVTHSITVDMVDVVDMVDAESEREPPSIPQDVVRSVTFHENEIPMHPIMPESKADREVLTDASDAV